MIDFLMEQSYHPKTANKNYSNYTFTKIKFDNSTKCLIYLMFSSIFWKYYPMMNIFQKNSNLFEYISKDVSSLKCDPVLYPFSMKWSSGASRRMNKWEDKISVIRFNDAGNNEICEHVHSQECSNILPPIINM